MHHPKINPASAQSVALAQEGSSFPQVPVAVIPAAGDSHSAWAGTNQASCDAMLPLAGKPAIYWTLQDLSKFGVQRVAIVVKNRGNDLERFVSLLFGQRLDLRFVEPDRNLGVGYSVDLGAREFEASVPLVVVLGDTISRLSDLTEALHDDTVFVSEVGDPNRWCMASVNGARVTKLVDKPADPVETKYALTGIYYFARGRGDFASIVSLHVQENRRLELSHLLQPSIQAQRLQAHFAALWLDVGNPDHVYEAQARLIQSRSFNRLTLDQVRGVVTKTSSYEGKFFDEINYYRLLPEHLKIYFPRMVSCNTRPKQLELTLEYYAYPSLADLYLFSDLSSSLWKKIFMKMAAISRDLGSEDYGEGAETAEDIYVTKNFRRLEDFIASAPEIARPILMASNLKVNGRAVPPLSDAARLSESALKALAAKCRLTVIHGDLCFSNILCEPMRGLIKLIDPRGSFGRQGVLGDARYDVAKLAHSALGFYDYIVNDLYHFEIGNSREVRLEFPLRANQASIQEHFTEIFLDGGSLEEIQLITAWLFLSMLPLHADTPHRQVAFAARGMELLAALKL